MFVKGLWESAYTSNIWQTSWVKFSDGKTLPFLVKPWQTGTKGEIEKEGFAVMNPILGVWYNSMSLWGGKCIRGHIPSVRHDGGWVWSHASGRGCELHSYGGLWGTERQTERAYATHSSGESMGAARAYLLPMMKPNTMKTRIMVPATATTAMMMTGFCSLDMTVAAIKTQINNRKC